MVGSRMLRALLAAALLNTANLAFAGESVFGWIYTTDIQPKGKFEFEQKAWLQRSQSQGYYSYWKYATELEYGVTDNFQVAGYINTAYVNARQNGVDGTTGGPGTNLKPTDDPFGTYKKFELESVAVEFLHRILNPITDPIGLAIYLEPEVGPRERALEARLILQKNFLDDRLIVAGNLMYEAEREKTYEGVEHASMLDTTLGVSYRFADNMAAGLEYRNHQEFLGYWMDSREHSAHFFGPNFHYATKNWWVTAAWRHQLPWVKAFNQEQADVVVGNRIYGDEHARNEFMFKLGIPF